MKTLRKIVSVFMVLQIIIGFVLPVYCIESNENSNNEGETRPKVSVIVPVYKVEQYLRECLDSIKNQTLKDIEIICVDDGSPDNCGKILDEYAKEDKRFIIIHQENEGIPSARQAGMDIAKGEYIKYVDSDDYIDLRTLEICYNEAKKDDVDILIHGAYAFDQDKKWVRIELKYKLNLEQSFYCYTGYVWDHMYRTDFLRKYGVNYKNVANMVEDRCYNMQCAPLLKKVKLIPDILYYYRQHSASLVHSISKELNVIDLCHNMIFVYNHWKDRNYFINKEAKVAFLKWALNLIYWPEDNKVCNMFYNAFKSVDSDLTTNKDILNKLTKHERYKLYRVLNNGSVKNNKNKKTNRLRRKNNSHVNRINRKTNRLRRKNNSHIKRRIINRRK